MSFEFRKTFLLVLAFALPGWADDVERDQHVAWSSPTLAAFYTVDEQGRSQREYPAVQTLAQPQPRKSGTAGTGKSRDKQEVEARGAPPTKIVIRVRNKPVDTFAAHRCERFGFYYTSDGRCVLPAGGSKRMQRAD